MTHSETTRKWAQLFRDRTTGTEKLWQGDPLYLQYTRELIEEVLREIAPATLTEQDIEDLRQELTIAVLQGVKILRDRKHPTLVAQVREHLRTRVWAFVKAQRAENQARTLLRREKALAPSASLPIEETTIALAEERQRVLAQVLAGLDERSRRLLELRCQEDRTLQETGDLLGLTRERVRQLQDELLTHLRHSPRGRELIGVLPDIPSALFEELFTCRERHQFKGVARTEVRPAIEVITPVAFLNSCRVETPPLAVLSSAALNPEWEGVVEGLSEAWVRRLQHSWCRLQVRRRLSEAARPLFQLTLRQELAETTAPARALLWGISC